MSTPSIHGSGGIQPTQPSKASQAAKVGLTLLAVGIITALGVVLAAHLGASLPDVLTSHTFQLASEIAGGVALGGVVGKLAHSFFSAKRKEAALERSLQETKVRRETDTMNAAIRHHRDDYIERPKVSSAYSLPETKISTLAKPRLVTTEAAQNDSSFIENSNSQTFVDCTHKRTLELCFSKTNTAPAQIASNRINEGVVEIYSENNSVDLGRVAATISAKYQALYTERRAAKASESTLQAAGRFLGLSEGPDLDAQEKKQCMADAIESCRSLLGEARYALFVKTEDAVFAAHSDPLRLTMKNEVVESQQKGVTLYDRGGLKKNAATFIFGDANFTFHAPSKGVEGALQRPSDQSSSRTLLNGAISDEHPESVEADYDQGNTSTMACMTYTPKWRD